jgi:2-dehydropantoate 2-reductase
MRVLVVGAGAVGGYFGGRLLQAGRDVTFLVRPGRAEQIRKNGFAVRVAAERADELAVRAIVSEQIEAPYDLVLVSCKAYDLESAMDGFAPAVGPETAILPLLNGLRHLDLLSERFDASRLLGGQCIITATLDERGHAVLLGRTPTLTFGELNGASSKRTDAIATTMQDAGFTVQASNAVLLEMWEKWVLLATFAGVTCLMRGAIGDIVAAGAAGLIEALLEECRHIAASQDQMIRPDVLQRIRALLTEAGSTATASMLRDLERGTMTEADHVLGDLLHRQSELALSVAIADRVSTFEDLRSAASERRNPFGRRLIDRPHGDSL